MIIINFWIIDCISITHAQDYLDHLIDLMLLINHFQVILDWVSPIALPCTLPHIILNIEEKVLITFEVLLLSQVIDH